MDESTREFQTGSSSHLSAAASVQKHLYPAAVILKVFPETHFKRLNLLNGRAARWRFVTLQFGELNAAGRGVASPLCTS